MGTRRLCRLAAAPDPMPPVAPSLFDFSAPLLDGSIVSLRRFQGEVLLIVNTASRCGFTPQLAGLEALYRAYRDRGFSVLAFPCNQFGAQEPGSATEIERFCRSNYEASFSVFAKIEVNGPGAHPLYRFLKTRQPGFFGALLRGRIPWNFTKFLVDRQGCVRARYGPATEPAKLASAIERLLETN